MNTPKPEDLRAEIETFLDAQHTMTLATVDDEGLAHAASLLYACDGLALLWTSDPKTRHSRHLDARPRVAATVAPDYDDFKTIRGVQIHGRAARIMDAAAIDAARARMAARYPFLRKLADAPGALREAWAHAAFYRLEPSRIALIDNTKGFGHKTVLDL